jgi:hypothetical protein
VFSYESDSNHGDYVNALVKKLASRGFANVSLGQNHRCVWERLVETSTITYEVESGARLSVEVFSCPSPSLGRLIAIADAKDAEGWQEITEVLRTVSCDRVRPE